MSSPLDWTPRPTARPAHWTAAAVGLPHPDVEHAAWGLRGKCEPMSIPVRPFHSCAGAALADAADSALPSTSALERSLSATLDPRGGWAGGGALVADENGFTSLFDGASTQAWEMAGSGQFVVVDGRLESVPGPDDGVFWCTQPMPPDFVLRLDWLRWRHEDSSGVFLRFPRPRSQGGMSSAFAPMRAGFEVQIDEVGIPGATGIHRTGAIFNEPDQHLTPHPARPAAEWNEFEITVRGQHYSVRLNGRPVTTFVNGDANRGLPSVPSSPTFVGLQVSPGSRVAFRNIRMRPL